MITGTNHFTNFSAAANYYRVLDINREQVLEKIRTDEIIIGPPAINANEMLSIRDGRYHIIEIEPQRSERKNQEVR